MRVVMISDTHEKHDQIIVPDGDLLIHAGDITMMGKLTKIAEFGDWFRAQPHKWKIVVAGNHDFGFERFPEASRDALGYCDRFAYLENSGVTIEGGLKIWGSPVSPWFHDWAFNVRRGAPIKTAWDKIPEDTDILITHGPPRGILDTMSPQEGEEHLGCDDLAQAVNQINPKIHVFGHIHGGHGHFERKHRTHFFNASVLDEAYNAVYPPQVFDLYEKVLGRIN